MASTCSILAISGADMCVSLNRITDVREITRRPRIMDNRPISSSVMPSAKYCWAGSPDRLFRGKTARDVILGWVWPARPQSIT